MRPANVNLSAVWGVKSRHDDWLIEAGEFETEEDALAFIDWCHDREVDDNEVEERGPALLAEWRAEQEPSFREQVDKATRILSDRGWYLTQNHTGEFSLRRPPDEPGEREITKHMNPDELIEFAGIGKE